MKIYSSGNNFIIENNGITYSAFYKNVVINQVFGNSGGVPYYTIKNVDGWNSSELINISDVTNNTGMYYTENSFESFFTKLIKQDPITYSLPSHIETISVEDIDNWNTAFNKKLVGVVITGTTTKTLILTFEDNTTLTTTFSDEQGVTSDGNDYVDSVGFNSTTGVLTVGRTGTLSDITVSFDGRYLTSLPVHTHTKADITDFAHTHSWGDITGAPAFITTETDPTVPSHVKSILVQDISNWNTAFNKRLIGAVVTGDENKVLTLTFGDSSILTASFTDNAGVADGDEYVNSLNFNTTTGVLTVGRTGALTDITASLDGRYLTTLPAHTHTKAEITDFAHTHAWGDITGAPAFITTETDPTVPSHVKNITTTDISNWNAATSSSASIPQWTASTYTTGATVSYNGTIWRAKTNTLTTDIPSAGTKWAAATAITDGGVLNLTFTQLDFIYTWKNYILEYVSDVSNDIRFSKDSGKTWTTWVNTNGHIAMVHIFSEGTVMFCTTSKVFTTKDFVTVTESTVLDFDGTPFVPVATHFFSIDDQNNQIVKIDGVEMVAFGDYMITAATGQSAYISRFWYSTDYGATVKCAIKKGTTVISGVTYNPRHIHCYSYNEHRNKFIITSGDSGSECQVIESIYTPATDTWEHERMVSGSLFKFGCVYFDEDFTYFVCDYTDGTNVGIKRCNSDMLDDPSAYEYIYKADSPNDWSTLGLIAYHEDSNGNRILTGDEQGTNELYYAKNDFNFKKVTHNIPNTIARLTSVNYNGDQYAILFTPNYLDFGTVRRKYLNLSQGFRDAGIYDFNQEKAFKGKNEPLKDKSLVNARSLTGTSVVLHKDGNIYNYTTPSAVTTYTLDLTITPKINDFARCFINTPTKPVVTGAVEISGGAAWVASTVMEMVIECPIQGTYEYYFLTR